MLKYVLVTSFVDTEKLALHTYVVEFAALPNRDQLYLLYRQKNWVFPNFSSFSFPVGTWKERPLGVELRGDAADGPDVDGRVVAGGTEENLGRAVPAREKKKQMFKKNAKTIHSGRLVCVL